MYTSSSMSATAAGSLGLNASSLGISLAGGLGQASVSGNIAVNYGNITINSGNITINGGSITVTGGDVTADGISLKGHTHTDVVQGSEDSGPPKT